MELEQIFAHAVALDQKGQLKNSIICKDSNVWIVNYDRTVILKFELPDLALPFKEEISFNANDYDSANFKMVDGRVVFYQKSGGFERSKSCTPAKVPDVESVWDSMVSDHFDPKDCSKFSIVSDFLGLLDENLSHIEFKAENKKLVIVQRDIFGGNIIEVKRKMEGSLGLSRPDKIQSDFEPIGIRTNDFLALFSFSKTIDILVNPKSPGRCLVSSERARFVGIISWGVYDELGTVSYLINDGGEENARRKIEKVGECVETTNRSPLLRRRKC